MFLGVWWNPFSWGQDILDGIVSFFYGILLSIDCIIYSFVSYIYQIFLVLAQGGDIIDDKFIGDLVNRIYIVIGVVMLFLIAYSLLRAMINLDDIKGKKSPVNIVKDVIISVVLIALLPTIFEFAFDFQNSLLINNTIGKLIVGTSGTGNPETTIRMGGYNMAAGVFKAFLHAHPDYCDTKAEESNKVNEAGQPCKVIEVSSGTTYGDLWDEAQESTTFWALARVGPKIVSGEVNYYILIAPAAGVFVILVLLSYCLDMAIRLVKLAVYEVIAPIPIFARVMPNEQAKKVFSNWLKATLSTFTEVFIRIAILYFAVFLISVVTSSINNIFSPLVSGSARLDILLFAQALIIIGIVMFVKQAPEIIKEITGLDGGKYNVFGSAMKAASAIGGLATAGVNNWNNKKDVDDNDKSKPSRFRSALGGAGSALFRSMNNRDNIKDFKSTKENAHNTAEAAIKKRIERENKAKERDEFLRAQGEGEFGMNARDLGEKLSGAYKYRAHKTKEAIRDWSGVDGQTALAAERIQELAGKIDSGFSGLEGTWKKAQSFIDAKAEAEKSAAEERIQKEAHSFDKIVEDMLRIHNLDKENKDDLKKAQELAIDEIKAKDGYDLRPVIEQANHDKRIQEYRAQEERSKKADAVGAAARNIQLSLSQYSDIGIDPKALISSERNEGKRKAMQAAFDKFGDLSKTENYDKFISAMRDGTDKEKKEAAAFIDVLDKINNEAKKRSADAAYEKARRESSFSSSSGSGDKK